MLAPGGSDSVHLVAGRDGSPGPRPSTASLLQQLPGDQFQWVLEAALLAARASIDHFTRCGGLGDEQISCRCPVS